MDNKDKYYLTKRNWRIKNSEKLKKDKDEYRKSHLEKFRVYQKKYRLKNISKINKWKKDYKENSRKYFKKRRGTLEYRYKIYIYSAKNRGHSFNLTFDEFKTITNLPCHYCGYKDSLVGIDRKNNSRGYEINNSLPCCRECNYFKGKGSYGRLVYMCKKIGKHLLNEKELG